MKTKTVPPPKQDPIAQANVLVMQRAWVDILNAQDKLLALFERRAAEYKAHPLKSRARRLKCVLAWCLHVQQLSECSCQDCWQQGQRLLEVAELLEQGKCLEVDQVECQGERDFQAKRRDYGGRS